MQRLAELERRIQRARQSIQSFKVEMRDLPNDLLPEYEQESYDDRRLPIMTMTGRNPHTSGRVLGLADVRY
jgi:hypothetical protein